MVEVPLRDPGDLARLLEGGFDIAYVSPGQIADVVIWNDDELQRLGETGLHYRVSQPNLEDYFAQRLQPVRDDMGGYFTLEEIEEEIFILHEDFPDLVSEPVSIGETIEERDIWAIKISDNPEDDEDEPEVLLTSLIHAREPITVHVLIAVMYHLIDNYEDDEYITRLVDERETWFIPCHNPDGYLYNEEIEPDGGGMWRKNRRENRDGTMGVDLNRNWGNHWGFDNVGSSPNGEDQTYRGTAAFSEPETQAAREFVNDHNFVTSIYFHSYSNLCLYPFGYDYIHADDRALMIALSEEMTRINHYLPGTGWEVIYLTNGDSDDWLYETEEHDPIMAFTIEVGSRQDSFWPPRNRIVPLVNENIVTCLSIIDYAGVPERALRPFPPENVNFFADDRGQPHLFWEAPEDDINPPVFYRIIAQFPGQPFVDEVALNNDFWDLHNVSISGFLPHSNPRCYQMNVRSGIATLTTTEDIPAPDTLRAWLKFNLTRDNSLALEVSEDGYDWIAVPGMNTVDIIRGGYNHGPGIQRRQTDDWEHYWWDLREWEDRSIRFRFRYYRFGQNGWNDNVYIDDIGLLPRFNIREIVAEDIEETEWIDRENNVNERLRYIVQSVDAEGDASFWSQPAIPRVAPDPFILPIEEGWSMISVPSEPFHPRVEDIFADFNDRGILALLKDGQGRFYSPAFNFNQIGTWNPTNGYWIKMDEDAELEFLGERIDIDTPIPLSRSWNLIAYLPDDPLPADEALASIEDNLLFVKDDHGRFWAVAQDFSNLADMELGEGYLIKVEDADILVYPDEVVAIQREESSKDVTYNEFTPPSPDNHSLLLIMEEPLPDGEIVLRNDDNKISGLTILESNQPKVGIAAWGEPEPSECGYAYNEQFKIYWRENEDSEEFPLEFSLVEGDPAWQTNGFSVLGVRSSDDLNVPTDIGLILAYPNPFNSSVELSYRVHESSIVRLSIYDAAGRLVKEILNSGQSAGRHNVVWDGSEYPSGLYVARVEVGRSSVKSSQLKLLLIQ